MATTNNIGLYCFDTGEEDAKTSLEALFGAGNSNMKKIDDAIGELRKKSFIVNTEADLNALLTEENLGKTVSYNGALYVITEGGSSNAPIAVGDTIDKIYFDTTKSAEEVYDALLELDWDNPDVDEDAKGIYLVNNENGQGVFVLNMSGVLGIQTITTEGGGLHFAYSTATDPSALGLSAWGWQNLDASGEVDLGETLAVSSVNAQQDTVWGSFVSKAPFGESTGGGIIAKPVGAEGGSGLPSFAPEDAGKFLRVDSNGNIVAEAIAYAEGESF